MIEKFFALKLWTEYIIPAAIIALVIGSFFVKEIVSNIGWSKKEEWLKTNGYERYLIEPMNGYHDAIYEWRNKENLKRIRENSAKRMKYKYFIHMMNGGL